MRQLPTSLVFLICTACAGDAPPSPGGPGEPDAGIEPPVEAHPVSGKLIDYFSNLPREAAMITVDGLDAPKLTTTIAEGAYTFDKVPTGSKVFMTVSLAAYRLTRNMPVSVVDQPVTQDIHVVSTADVERIYATDGKNPTLGKALVIAELQKEDGTPLEAIPLTDVKLLDTLGAPVPGVIGPYTMNAVGDIVPATLNTELHAGKVRVAFLDVPAGTSVVTASYTVNAVIITVRGQLLALADGVTFTRAGSPMGGGPPPMPVLDPLFEMHIYPRLQKASVGGLACGNCHTAGGSGAVLIMDAPAADVLAALKAKLGLIDLVTPANSLLLTKPLYELPPALQNHPNATFADINDRDYQLVMLWIQNGTKP